MPSLPGTPNWLRDTGNPTPRALTSSPSSRPTSKTPSSRKMQVSDPPRDAWPGPVHVKCYIFVLPMAISECQAREASGTDVACYFLFSSHPPDSEGRSQNLLPAAEEKLTQRQGCSSLWKTTLSSSRRQDMEGLLVLCSVPRHVTPSVFTMGHNFPLLCSPGKAFLG